MEISIETLIILTLALTVLSVKYENVLLKKKIDIQKSLFDDLYNLMWGHGAFMDSDGKTERDYNKKEIEQLWTKYHYIGDQFRNIK